MEEEMISNSCKVLLVDDEMLPRKLLANCLEKIPNVTATGMANGKLAKEYLCEHIVDLVITDIQMPVMDGLELAAFISEHFPNIITIIISGFGEFEYAKQAIRYGVKDYLLKPIQLQNVENIVAGCMEQIFQRRVQLLKKRYNEQEAEEALLSRFLSSSYPKDDCAEVEAMIAGEANVIGIRPSKEMGTREDNIRGYKHLLAGVLDGYTVFALGRYRGEYRYLITKKLRNAPDLLKAIPEYLERVLNEKVRCVEVGTVKNALDLYNVNSSVPADDSTLVIERACMFMKENLGKSLSREMVAEHVYLSSSHFGHLFKRVKGIGYNAYLTDLRMEKSKELLLRNMSVAEVAEAVGYRDPKYFSEIFCQKTGCFPSEYKMLRLSNEIV